MVMQYANHGNLRQFLNGEFNSLNWYNKFKILCQIAHGLGNIHKEGLIHQDFHSGNILSHDNFKGFDDFKYFISDLGLSKSANEKSEKNKKNVYEVLPYVAPKVLRGKIYTQESDVYNNFGTITYEIFTGLSPYYDMLHEEFLVIKICHQVLDLKSLN
ncbi:kinase-like domain-containing protein [Glomus cerebriforme]|uniref:Kinase-like domain-containing protein n=1 Tax=Glomus cerebriforme TaxID=658196 RepID=A0A397SGI6_9GLOM|nr:kinase-like domain-containing protein [Glomus cerebriforme]